MTLNSNFIPYIELLKYYSASKIILVPLKYPIEREGCQGMTSLQDAVALAKSLIITKNNGQNLDPEIEGIGWVVEKGDVNGWVVAITKLMEDDHEQEMMKLNSIRVYNEIFNSEIFSQMLEFTFQNVYNQAYDSKKTL